MNKRAPCSPLSATTETGGSLTRQRARLQGQSDQDLIVLESIWIEILGWENLDQRAFFG